MKAATLPVQRPRDARLLVVDADGRLAAHERADLPELLAAGDLVVANDAATLPASLSGRHLPSGATIELRLAGRTAAGAPDEAQRFSAVVFGAGDFRMRTEDRPVPPPLAPGDRLDLGPLEAEVLRTLGHPRLVEVRFAGDADAVHAGIARHGRPVQYAHLAEPLALWDVWTRIAGPPVAFEPPSAGFALDWQGLRALRGRGARFATLTHAAGLSSTGDPALDARLPFDEPYFVPAATAAAIAQARAGGGRVVAIGTTVVRALEHAASRHMGRVPPGQGLAMQKIGPTTRLQVVDVLLSGTHEPGTSHYELLRAFTDDAALLRADAALEREQYRTHEFGDSVWIEQRIALKTWRRTPALAAA